METVASVIPLLLKNGCPCRYPRFVNIVAFNYQDFGTGPVACGDTEQLVGAAIEGQAAFLKLQSEEQVQDSTHRRYQCTRCGAFWEYVFTDYSISMYRTYLRLLTEPGPALGASVSLPIPISTGLRGFKKEDLETYGKSFRKSTLAECVSYMAANN
jgi:hypothetical protein